MICRYAMTLDHCPLLQDAVPGSALTVTACKANNKGECHRCFYIRRGSFRKLSAGQLRALLKKHPSLREKFFGTIQFDMCVCAFVVCRISVHSQGPPHSQFLCEVRFQVSRVSSISNLTSGTRLACVFSQFGHSCVIT